MGFFDETVKNTFQRYNDDTRKKVTKEDILADLDSYCNFLPDDIYEAITDDPELMAEVIEALLKNRKDEGDGVSARTLYRDKKRQRTISR